MFTIFFSIRAMWWRMARPVWCASLWVLSSLMTVLWGCSIPIQTGQDGNLSSKDAGGLEQAADGSEARKERAPWEDQPITPWEGLDVDAGIPEGYVWGEPGAGFVNKVISFRPAKNVSFGYDQFPEIISGPPHGFGAQRGSLHVLSLGCGGSIILEFSDPLIGDGPGADFIIFENAFGAADNAFSEPAQVSVSVDGQRWFDYPCSPATSAWPFPQCAGTKPVYAHPDNKIDPYDPQSAGGNAYDLKDVGLPFARFIKIVDRSRELPDAAVWCGGHNAGFDLDAISVIWGYRPPKHPP